MRGIASVFASLLALLPGKTEEIRTILPSGFAMNAYTGELCAAESNLSGYAKEVNLSGGQEPYKLRTGGSDCHIVHFRIIGDAYLTTADGSNMELRYPSACSTPRGPLGPLKVGDTINILPEERQNYQRDPFWGGSRDLRVPLPEEECEIQLRVDGFLLTGNPPSYQMFATLFIPENCGQ
ncbi:MAG: hypothetical protein HYW25_03450 [Candidatus Aenigmarchaeota archaeon]|nr:hypothetical protein [Candidatus Aenigmarchaeota archaeon]